MNVSLDLNALKDEILSVANTIIAELFHIRMVSAIGSMYCNEIIGYCDAYVKNYNEQKAAGRSVNDNVAGTVKSIKEIILSKGKDRFDARYDLDLTALNHLIIYSTFRSISQGPFVTEVEMGNLRNDVFKMGQVFTKFSTKVKNLTTCRNKFQHTAATRDELRPDRDAENYLIKILECVVEVESFLNYLRSTGWRDVGVLEYYVRMEDRISNIKDKIFFQSEKLTKTVFRCKNKKLQEKVKVSLQKVDGAIHKLMATWYVSNDDIEIHLAQGRYCLEVGKGGDSYEILPSANLSVLGDGISTIFEYQLEKVLTDEEKLVSAFGGILCEKEIDRNLQVLQELDGKQYYPAIQLLAFMYRYGLCVNQDRDRADEYQLVMTSLVRADELWQYAETAKEKQNLLLAAVLYLGYSMNSDSGAGYYRAASCLMKSRKGYSFCLQCLKLAMDKNYVDENAPDGITVERMVKQLESPIGRAKFS